MAVELSQAQKDAVRQWVAEGASLSDVQKRLTQEFQISLTYMDVRLLVLDLGSDVKDRGRRTDPAAPLGAAKPAAPGADPAAGGPDAGSPLGGAVKVQVDRITKPGTLVSGTVAFSDGVTAVWSLDQGGRLMLNASRPGYRPSEPDVRAFQDELRAALERSGF